MKPKRRPGIRRNLPVTQPGRPAPEPVRPLWSQRPREIRACDILDEYRRMDLLTWTEIAAAQLYRDSVSPRAAGSETVRPELSRRVGHRMAPDGRWKQDLAARGYDDVTRAQAHRAFARKACGEATEALMFAVFVRGLTIVAYARDMGVDTQWGERKLGHLLRAGCRALAEAYGSAAGRVLLSRGFKNEG